MYRVARDKIVAEAEPPEHNKAEGGSIGIVGALHGFRVPLVQPLLGLLQNEGGKPQVHRKGN